VLGLAVGCWEWSPGTRQPLRLAHDPAGAAKCLVRIPAPKVLAQGPAIPGARVRLALGFLVRRVMGVLGVPAVLWKPVIERSPAESRARSVRPTGGPVAWVGVAALGGLTAYFA
jgi:hypothetical protein